MLISRFHPGRARREIPLNRNLPLDPMPDCIDPCLALLKPKPPKGPQSAFEVKWDGYRMAVHIEPSGVRILTRGGHDRTNRFPAITAEASRLPVATAILDGGSRCLRRAWQVVFRLLQQSLGGLDTLPMFVRSLPFRTR
jgi:bifunctional non-homologous end joining protein LigD